MFNLKTASLSLATIALATTAGTLFAATAQAAIIGGQISGIWEYDFDGEGGYNAGDAFTAEYTYDSDKVITQEFSYISESSNTVYEHKTLRKYVSLLSLVINSGEISQVFNLGSGSYSQLRWTNNQVNPTDNQATRTGYYVHVYDASSPQNAFTAINESGQNSNGSLFSEIFAAAVYYDFNGVGYDYSPLSARTYNVTFSDPFLADPSAPTVSTPEPTSALLTGLFGLGVMALHRRKKIETTAE